MDASIPARLPALRCRSLLALALLTACGSSNNSGTANDPDGSGQTQKYVVLRPNIGLDLSKVASFAVVGAGTGGQPFWSGGDTGTLIATLEGQGLVALMLNGDVSPVALTEMSDGSTSTANQPAISAIYATPQWVLMSAGWQLPQPQPDGQTKFLDCQTIAVHRPDGAMYCASIGIRHTGTNGEDLEYPVHANSSGSVVFLLSSDSLNRNIVYKLVAGPKGEPSASLVDAKLHPNWFVVNASGDMLVQSNSSASSQDGALMEIRPVDGADPVTVTGAHNAYSIAGAPTGTNADTFYVVNGGGGGWPFDGTIRVLKKVSGIFQETDVAISMPDMNCSGLFPLADGHYMFCGGQSGLHLARALVDGQVQTSPKLVAFTGIANPNAVGGLPFRVGGGVFYLLGKGASGRFFARHNGLIQQDIPLSPNIELLSMSATTSGGLDIVGVDDTTNSKVRATIKPGATEVTILSAEGVSLAEVVVFTRIN